MDIFTSNKLFWRLVLLLLFLNILSTAYLFWHRPDDKMDREPKRRKENSVQFLKDKLHLTHDQELQIRAMREKYTREEEKVSSVIRAQRDSMNRLMFSADSDTSKLRLIAARVAANEFNMEMLRIQQAEEFKKCCTPEQVEVFRQMMVPIRDFFQPEKKKE